MEGTICVEGTDTVWPAPRFDAKNEELLLDAGAALVHVDIRGPLTEEAENTGADVRPVDMPPTTCVGGTEKDVLPTACVGGTENDGSSTSMGELPWKEENGPCW